MFVRHPLSNLPWRPRRQGNIITLACVLMPFTLGMVAFAVDTSWLVLTRSELQNAADSAAMAGANRLGDNFVLYSLGSQTLSNRVALISGAVTAAKSAATTYAAANSAGGVASLNLLDSDIDIGYTSSAGVYTSNSVNATLYPNTVKVTLRRDSSANTSLSMFFAPILGISKMDVQATATAMAYGATVSSFNTSGAYATGMLPITYDVNHWDEFLSAGRDVDGNTTLDAAGNPALQVYPSIKDTGNFGWISLNDSHVGASTLSNWITSGPTKADIQALIDHGLIPLSPLNASLWTWQAENGFKSSDVSTVNVNIGKEYVIPLFMPKSTDPYEAGEGTGSNYNYNVVRFVGIKIMQPTDANRLVVIQPVPINDPTMILNSSSIAPLSSSGNTTVTAMAPPKLIN